MDQLEQLATTLTTLPASHVFPGQLCAARYSQDEAMYRAEVISVKDQVVRVMFIDNGNTEENTILEVFMMPEELLVPPPYAVKLELASAVQEDEEGEMEVEQFPPPEIDENLMSKKGKIIEAEMDEGKDDLAPTPVIVTMVEDVNTVWVTKSSSLPVLEMMMDQLANMEEELVKLTEVHKGDIVVARFSEDDGLYRGKVISNTDISIAVLFMDYGMKEEVPATKVWRLPEQLGEHEAMAVQGRVEHVEVFEDSVENRETMDSELDKEGIMMRFNLNNEASFWIGEEKIKFKVAKSVHGHPVFVGGWQVGDEVTFWTEESKRWRKGTISRLEESQATVQEAGEHPAVHNKVDLRHLKPAGMPVEVLNQVEEGDNLRTGG